MTSRETLISGIADRVARIEAARQIELEKFISNREHNIGVAHFVSDTIRTVDPEHIDVSWMGSYSDSLVRGYPVVEIRAHMRKTHAQLCGYSIYCGGDRLQAEITSDRILEDMDKGLKELEARQNRGY